MKLLVILIVLALIACAVWQLFFKTEKVTGTNSNINQTPVEYNNKEECLRACLDQYCPKGDYCSLDPALSRCQKNCNENYL